MAFRRDTARALQRAFNDEKSFVDAVAHELEAGRIKRKEAEKLIIHWHQAKDKVQYQIEWALRVRYSM